MFFPLGVDPEAYQKFSEAAKKNKSKQDKLAKLEKKMEELKVAMNDYFKCLADHPSISFSGMMYYGSLNSQYMKLKQEYDTIKESNKRSINLSNTVSNTKQTSKQILNENQTTRKLRKRKHVNYKV